MPNTLNQRIKRLVQLIGTESFDSQEGLLLKLKEEGFDVTQTTLSRDLHKIGAYKEHGNYVLAKLDYALKRMGRIKTIRFCPPNLIVIKTVAGLAQATGLFIDNAKINGVAGTVTGDDTIFVGLSDPEKNVVILSELQRILAE
ncbi:MAG: arginine repressor [uncultured bacterium]|nr:MAG: arginine repressor [uncultured bacterium]HLD44908.1 arginine repressor [bacterium]